MHEGVLLLDYNTNLGGIIMSSRSRTALKVISVVLLAASLFAIYKGFDCILNYRNSDFSSLNVNAYVGGDAYNYIINGTYFAGYMALGGGALVSAALLWCSALKLEAIDSAKETLNKMTSFTLTQSKADHADKGKDNHTTTLTFHASNHDITQPKEPKEPEYKEPKIPNNAQPTILGQDGSTLTPPTQEK